MRASALTTFIFSTTALANWNPKLCGGAGGCLGITWWPGTDYSCPDGTYLTAQQVAQNTLDVDSGSYDLVSKEDFPTECARGVTPGPRDTLVVHTAAHQTGSQKFYIFISETCREKAPVADCYNQNPNPSG